MAGSKNTPNNQRISQSINAAPKMAKKTDLMADPTSFQKTDFFFESGLTPRIPCITLPPSLH
jgi:hypothetical protein